MHCVRWSDRTYEVCIYCVCDAITRGQEVWFASHMVIATYVIRFASNIATTWTSPSHPSPGFSDCNRIFSAGLTIVKQQLWMYGRLLAVISLVQFAQASVYHIWGLYNGLMTGAGEEGNPTPGVTKPLLAAGSIPACYVFQIEHPPPLCPLTTPHPFFHSYIYTGFLTFTLIRFISFNYSPCFFP